MDRMEYLECLKKHSLMLDSDKDEFWFRLYCLVGEEVFVPMMLRKDLVFEFLSFLSKYRSDYRGFVQKSSVFVASDVRLFQFILQNPDSVSFNIDPRMLVRLREYDAILAVDDVGRYFRSLFLVALTVNHDL